MEFVETKHNLWNLLLMNISTSEKILASTLIVFYKLALK